MKGSLKQLQLFFFHTLVASVDAQKEFQGPFGWGNAAVRFVRSPSFRVHFEALWAFSPSRSRQQFIVELRVDEPRVGVVLHQAVDFLLGREKAGHVGLLEILDDFVFGVKVQVDLQQTREIWVHAVRFAKLARRPGERDSMKPRYLFGSFVFDELLVNAVGLGRQLLVRREHPQVLAGVPKLNVLLAELGLQEDAKGHLSICAGTTNTRDVIAPL